MKNSLSRLLISAVLALSLGSMAQAGAPIKDASLSGSSSVASGTFSVASGATLSSASGSTVNLSLGSVTLPSGVSLLGSSIDLTSEITGILPKANGGTGTATPALVAGTGITITGTWPAQTITGSGSFLQLSDAPSSYSGQASKLVAVNSGATGLEFVSAAASGTASGDLSGTYPSPTVAKVNGITVTGTPTSGQVLTATSGTAANWATPATDPTARHSRVTRTAAQSISNNSITALSFDSEVYDTDGQHSNVTNATRLTAQKAGKYLVFASVQFAVNSTGYRYLYARKNGTSRIATIGIPADTGASATTHLTLSTIIDLALSDYVEILVFQTSGGTLNVELNEERSPVGGMSYLVP